VSRVFERSDQLKEKVFDVKLRIDEWRVLFAVNGAMDSQAIADFLELDESDVDGTLDKLLDMKFLTAFDTNSKAEEETVVVEELEEETETLEDTAEELFEEEEEEEEAFTVEAAAAGETISGEVDLEEMISESAEEMSEEEPSAEDDLDELIGNLLEEEPGEAPQAEEPGEDIDFSEEPSAEKQETDEEFDLETIFQEEVAEAEEALEEAGVETEEEMPPAEEVAEPAAGQGTILVVDDSVVIRKMVEIALENESYNIVSVATGKEALNYLDETTPDLIILDIMLTDMNGLDVLKAIKASKQIPVVMLSAKDTPRETTKAKQLGADDFIPKPFKDEELVGKIKELINR